MTAVRSLAELGERVRQARRMRGRSQADVARQLGVDRSALARIESGDRKVSALELLHLGDILDVPVQHLVSRSPAAMTSQRRIEEDEPGPRERLVQETRTLLEQHLRDAELLRSEGYLASVGHVPTGAAGTAENSIDLARQVRSFLGRGIQPLGSMLAVCESLGLYLLVVDSDTEGASMTPEAGFGVGVVGGKAPPGRRRSTAAHELGHHVLGDEYHSDAGVAASRTEREQLIDVFAAELLLPGDVVAGRLAGAASDTERWEALVRLAAEYRVSWSVVVRAARHVSTPEVDVLDRVPLRGDFLRVLGEEPAEDLPLGGTGPVWRTAVLSMYVAGRVTRSRAVELLHGAVSEDDLPDSPDPLP